MKKVIIVIILLYINVGIQAQSGITGYEARYYFAGATSPFQTESIPSSSYTCNQPPPTTTINANPNKIVWDDPAASGRVCIFTENPGGVLLSFPLGNYEATLVAINSIGVSGESTRAPFVIGSTPPVPTGVRIIR